MRFNPRSYVRSDPIDYTKLTSAMAFQSTLLREERHSYRRYANSDRGFNPRSYVRSDKRASKTVTHGVCFNPRSYVRSDTLWRRPRSLELVFQSTLLREERRENAEYLDDITKFQSTLLREERRLSIFASPLIVSFNPRSYVRSDLREKYPHNNYYGFQSTLLREERPIVGQHPWVSDVVSIHAPT